MNALEARKAMRRRAGLPIEEPKSAAMAEWLDRTWDELEAHEVEEKWETSWRDREDEWLANLARYERQVRKERGQ